MTHQSFPRLRRHLGALCCCLAAVQLGADPADARGAGPANLVMDASFEAPVGLWLAPAAPGSCCAGKELASAGSNGAAPDGAAVLAVQGWDPAGSVLLSPPIDLPADAYSATLDVRVAGTGDAPADVTVELALYDEAGKAKLASFGAAAAPGAAGKWATVYAAGVKVPGGARRGRLAVVVGGPQRGARVALDRLGLFAGSELGAASDNADFTWFEAEEIADGKAWKSVEHYPGWYADLPSGMKMLAGPDAVPEADNARAAREVAVRVAGPHRLWVRVMRTSASTRGVCTLALRQHGKVVASRELDSADPTLGPDFSWAWGSLDADLAAGPAEIVVTRPAGEASWVGRKLDLLALTNLTDYRPDAADFRPQGYVRFTNLGNAGQEPYCLWVFIRRMQPPVWYATPGIFSAAGFDGGHYVPPQRDKWLAPGDSTPWTKLSDHLVPAGNNVQFLATRASHNEGMPGAFRGRLEFAVGPERRVVRTVDIDQAAPRVLMTLPQDFQNEPEEILTATDYVRRGEAVAHSLGEPAGPPAKHLELEAHLLSSEGNDPRIVERELAIAKRLGFNAAFAPLAEPAKAVAFHEAHGLSTRFGLPGYQWGMFKANAAGEPCPGSPDLARIDESFKGEATRYAPIADKLARIKLADEPNVGYPHFTSCELCREQFRAALRARKLEPRDLGVESWEEVVPVAYTDRAKHPVLFYETGLFRLRTVAASFRALVDAKRRHLPAHVEAFVNYSPPLSWDHHGADPFLLHREGGLEMTWSEDWLGHGAGPQQASDTFAVMRAAGAGPEPQPMGAYGVGVSGGPLHQRMKLYTLLAAGVRTVNVYAYGPAYAGIDSWSTRYDIYPAVGGALREFARIDDALHGTTRRAADVAILYNRTAGIWAHATSTTEQDSRYTRWALSHAGYDADYVPEEDVVAGRLARYKVLYLNGPQLRRDAAEAIARWVRDDGGVLFGSAGAGSRDEHDRPMATLEAVFGARSADMKLEHDAGRPMFELRTLPVLDVLSAVPDSGAPGGSFNRLCVSETLSPAEGARVVLRDGSGRPAGVVTTHGKGRAVRVAAVPGIAYLNDAVRDKDYNPESYLPRAYRAELREFLTWPARLGGARPVATSDAPLLEVARYDAAGRAVLFVIDHGAEPRQLTLTLPDAARFTRARSARGRPVTLAKGNDGSLRVSLPLDVTDAVVLQEPADAAAAPGGKAR